MSEMAMNKIVSAVMLPFTGFATGYARSTRRDKIAILQENQDQVAIFVDIPQTGTSSKIRGSRYYTPSTFKGKFGVDFEEVLMNYFKIYAEKHGLDVSFDDNLITLIHLMKFMIKNRDKESEDWNFTEEFTATCQTPYTQHLISTQSNPFVVLEVGPGCQTTTDPTFTYVGIQNFVFTQRNVVYRVYFRY